MIANRRWIWGLAAVLLIGCWLGWAVYRDHYSPAAQVRRVAHAFWTSVEAGDQEAVQGFMAADSPQSASELVTLFHGYRYDGYANHLDVVRLEEWLQYALEYEVLTGLGSPDGHVRTFIVGVNTDADGMYRVLFVGKGFSTDPDGRLVPTLTTE